MRPIHRRCLAPLGLMLALGAAPGTRAARGTIDAPHRSDFEACYLTTEDKEERNLATLLRGLEVEILGRAPNGRWKVRLLDLRDSRVLLHDGWPGNAPPVGWVSPSFLVPSEPSAPVAPPPPADAAHILLGGGHWGMRDGGFLVPDFAGLIRSMTPGTSPPPTSTAGGLALPASPGTLTGSAWLARNMGRDGAARERAVLEAILAGHVPAFLRRFVPVTLEIPGPGDTRRRATVRVAPDYLAIGTDADFVRVPMTPGTAQRIADRAGCTLPRPRLVDAIWRQATTRLAPRTMSPGPRMSSTDYFGRHDRAIRGQLAGRPPGGLLAGHKKDIVLTDRLARQPGRVAIYGWHRASGRAIQPLSLVHGKGYVDYSHGARLVARTLVVDGHETTVDEVLGDPALAALLSADVPAKVTRYP